MTPLKGTRAVKIQIVTLLSMSLIDFPKLASSRSLQKKRSILKLSFLARQILPLVATACTVMIGGAYKAIAGPPSPSISEIIKQGRLKLNRGQPEQALLDARRAIELNSNVAEAYFLLGRSQQDIGLKSDALSSYSKAIELDPRYVSAYSNRGLVKGALGDMKGAIKDFDRAIEVDKSFAVAYLNRGVAFGAMGNARAALADFNSAIRVNSKYTDAYQNRGIAKELMGDIKGACTDWKLAAAMGSVESRSWHAKQCMRILETAK